jgi:hypothetical protein
MTSPKGSSSCSDTDDMAKLGCKARLLAEVTYGIDSDLDTEYERPYGSEFGVGS